MLSYANYLSAPEPHTDLTVLLLFGFKIKQELIYLNVKLRFSGVYTESLLTRPTSAAGRKMSKAEPKVSSLKGSLYNNQI